MANKTFTTVTFRKLSRKEIFEVANENGIQELEWGGDVHLAPDDTAALEEVLTLQKEYGIKAHSYGSYFWLLKNDESEFQKIVDVTDAIGAKIIRIWAGDKGSQKVSEQEFKAMVEEVQRLSEIAKAKGISIAFEYHHNTYNDSAESSVRLLKAINRDNVGTYWQPFTDETDMDNLRAALPYLLGVHVFAWTKAGVRHSLAFSQRRWKRYMQVIHENGKDPFWIMEFVKGDNPKQFKKDVKTLDKLLKSL